MAGLASLSISPRGDSSAFNLIEQEMLITDGPTVIGPSVDQGWCASYPCGGFELKVRQETLGVLSTNPVPAATFTAEASFKPPVDYAWSPAADEQLNERLNRLTDERANH